jgi:ABC-type transport system involved in multi-copper enzyme maturation permease subunit
MRILTIVRYTLLEAARAHLLWLLLATLLAAVLASLFLRELAITEAVRIQTASLAALTRLAAVIIVCLYVTSSMIRELNDKSLELLLSLDLGRGSYVCGKFAGFCVISLTIAGLICMPLLFLAPPSAVLRWGVSLTLELWIVVALSLFCIVTLSQIVPAVTFVLAFYMLARSIEAIQLIGESGLQNQSALSQRLMGWLVDALALLLPSLHVFTETGWLVNQTGQWASLLIVLMQSAIYLVLLLCATLFDFYRKDF